MARALGQTADKKGQTAMDNTDRTRELAGRLESLLVTDWWTAFKQLLTTDARWAKVNCTPAVFREGSYDKGDYRVMVDDWMRECGGAGYVVSAHSYEGTWRWEKHTATLEEALCVANAYADSKEAAALCDEFRIDGPEQKDTVQGTLKAYRATYTEKREWLSLAADITKSHCAWNPVWTCGEKNEVDRWREKYIASTLSELTGRTSRESLVADFYYMAEVLGECEDNGPEAFEATGLFIERIHTIGISMDNARKGGSL
jgi:hypothetical protein